MWSVGKCFCTFLMALMMKALKAIAWTHSQLLPLIAPLHIYSYSIIDTHTHQHMNQNNANDTNMDNNIQTYAPTHTNTLTHMLTINKLFFPPFHNIIIFVVEKKTEKITSKVIELHIAYTQKNYNVRAKFILHDKRKPYAWRVYCSVCLNLYTYLDLMLPEIVINKHTPTHTYNITIYILLVYCDDILV